LSIHGLTFIIETEEIMKSGQKSFWEEKAMANREKLLEEVFELALQNDMNYFG